jgi:hypothetical protein
MNPTYPYINAGTGCKITGMIAVADKILSLTDNFTKIVGGHSARQYSGPHEIPGHAHHFARSRSEIEVRAGSRRRKGVCRSRPRLGPRDHQLRPVDPNRLSDALSVPAEYFPDEESVKAVRIKEQQK